MGTPLIQTLPMAPSVPGGEDSAYERGGGCSLEILNLTPKGDRSQRGPSFFDL